MRITKKMLNQLIERLNDNLDRPADAYTKDASGQWTANAGHLQLDHNPIYGGYQLQEIVNSSGGVDDRVFGLDWGHRLTNKEMYYFLKGISY